MTQGAEVMSWAQQRISELEAENASLREERNQVHVTLERVIARPCCSIVGCDEHCPVEVVWPLVKANRQREAALSPQQAILPNYETVQENEDAA